jgi:hypothetical protein
VAVFIPLGDPFREFLLVLEAVIVFLMIQMGILYIRKFLRNKNYAIAAWGTLLIAFAGVFITYLVADYYIADEMMRGYVLTIGYGLGLTGSCLFAFNIEREIKQKHLFSGIIAIAIGFLIINAFLLIITPTYITIITWLIFIILVVVYIRKFTSIMSADKWRLNVYSLVFGTILVVLGFAANADLAVAFFGGLWMRCLGDFFIITGVLLVSVLFIGVPSISEFIWFEKIKILNIIYQNGISIAHYQFRKEKEDDNGKKPLDELLVAGGLASISQVISNIIQSEKHLETVDHGDVKLLFDYGKYLINVLVVDEVLETLRDKLKKFTKLVEFLYEDHLSRWDGDLTQFSLLDPIVQTTFEPQKKKEAKVRWPSFQ